ncbi:hypothetical protein SAMN05192558_105326 [Actinokineospora alba]|uniref:Uncharacterized protein n=1 Tax=Actinokineospora alba TaxID=504798 RepID=A0A1H0NFA0_9PSEU|nr:immune inhibitor A [Actinokineospora alba]TDP68696.1 hypothetical protein C8E96_4261 [Actinokineospora alba]SDH84726.1 hypothetical protein SAMN05421871_102376 [Actinokineospora alba]SDO91246.1 hypothetical protein SAMN05192558_105326 [Actinokineospora alba]
MSAKSLRYTVAALAAAAFVAVVSPFSPASAQFPASCEDGGHAHPDSKRAPGCVTASVRLDRLPAKGESATLTITLRSQLAIDAARLQVRLPRHLRLDTAGTSISAPRPVGLDQVAEERFALTTEGRTITLKVTALGAGPAQIQADVVDTADPSRARSAHGSTEFTVGERPGGSRAGVGGTDSPAVEAAAVQPTANGTATAVAPAQTGSVSAAGQICATGQFTYADNTGTWRVGRNVPVAVLGKATSSASTQTYATGLTSATDGRYSVCFTSPVTTMYSVSVRFSSASSVWQVTDNRGVSTYTVTTAAKTNVPSGTNPAFGTTSPTSTHMRGWHAFDTLNLLWAIRSSGTGCWTARETANCTKLTLHWQPGSTDGTYFDNDKPYGQRYVALMDGDPNSEHLVLHEAGHAFMDLLYGGWWPVFDCPDPHYLHKRSGPSCGWTEGFANAIAGHAKGDGLFVFPEGESVDLMNTTPFDPSRPASRTNPEDGDQVELRVAGALIDLWRKVDGGPAGTFDNMRRYGSTTFREWFNDDRPLTGLDVSATARNVVYTHTIDYRGTTPPPTGGVANGGFESGTANWTITGGVVGNWATYPAQQGSWYAWMGGNGQANTDTLSQQVTIPAGTSTLGYHLRVVTAETGSTVYDTLKVQVVDGSTTTTLGTWSNTNAGSSYVHRTASLSQWQGKTVTLKFVSVEDYSLRTDFLIDTVGITTS